MFRGYWFALMLSPRLTAPMRHVCHQEKGQCRRTVRSYPTVRSVAALSELLMPSERDRPEEDASCYDSDKSARTKTATMRARQPADDPLLATWCSRHNQLEPLRAGLRLIVRSLSSRKSRRARGKVRAAPTSSPRQSTADHPR